jgi:hypothetical protein
MLSGGVEGFEILVHILAPFWIRGLDFDREIMVLQLKLRGCVFIFGCNTSK